MTEDINGELTFAATIGNLKRIEYLLEEKNADINAKDNGGDTALICAVSMGHSKIVQYLVEVGKGKNLN